MPVMIVLRGISGSGKSTYRTKLGLPYVNRDELRLLYPAYTEKQITREQEARIIGYCELGLDFIIDNTHTRHAPYHGIAARYGYELREEWMNTGIDACLIRDYTRAASVGRSVIVKQAIDTGRYEQDPYFAYMREQNAIICDIDGTLADITHRREYVANKPKDWKQFFALQDRDTCNEEIREILERYRRDHWIILVSGRGEEHRKVTETWLRTHNIPFDLLFMRPFNSREDDDLIKARIYDTYIAPYIKCVKFVLDDRNRVVDMWRSKGLRVLQVAPGDF